mgnify:CR=1 FL=1
MPSFTASPLPLPSLLGGHHFVTNHDFGAFKTDRELAQIVVGLGAVIDKVVDEVRLRRAEPVRIPREVFRFHFAFVDQHLGGFQIDVRAVDLGGDFFVPSVGLMLGDLSRT